ncbi:MAG: site-2 protease family protein [Proteobacteria bacterium]|nr:site-2 protease family protein [Pseudomonadota bacterium]
MPQLDLSPLTILFFLITWAPGLILGITLHEAAHGFAARQCGDNTAYALGRVTLNPLKHIDPMGTIALPVLMGLMSGGSFIFGYAKPVPVNFSRLNDIKWDTVRVAVAGPAANFVIALLAVLLMHAAVLLPQLGQVLTIPGLVMAVKINVLLMVFNLVPVLPLDGGRVLQALLPHEAGRAFAETERWGFFLVMALAFSGILFRIIGPVMDILMSAMLQLAPRALYGM